MRILGLTSKNSGCGYHRVMVPVSLMPKERGRITDVCTDEVLDKGWDVVLLNRMWHDNIFEQRKKYGFKLVVDMDDYWIVDHYHISAMDYGFSNWDLQIVRFMREADMVTCTHERLAERIYPYNKSVVVLPNAIPYGEFQFTDTKEESDKLRFFWAGGISHEPDIKLLRNPISKLKGSAIEGKIKMLIGGYSDSNYTEQKTWGAMASYFTANMQLDSAALKAMDVFNYYTMYQHCDVSLIPLRKSNFNAYKSNIKILEAAGKKAPVICSSVHPYLGFPEDLVNYAHEDKMWLHWMHKLTDSEQMRKEQGEALREYVDKHYNFREINLQRRAAFDSLVPVSK